MSTRDKSSSNNPEKPRNLFARINIRLPWLKLVATIFIGIVIILDLLDLTISKTDDLSDDFPTTPMSKHLKATQRDLTNKKLVALTFDDGPSAETTPILLNVLTEKNAIATFFTLGVMARSHPDIVKRMNREGHEIASHTMYHQNLPRIPLDAAAADIKEASDVLKSILGRRPTLTRPPYGSFNDAVRDVTKTPLILWSVDPEDWRYREANKIIEIAMSQVHDGAIILIHDVYPSSVEAIPRLIDILRENGYEFVTISELAHFRKTPLVLGGAYYYFKP